MWSWLLGTIRLWALLRVQASWRRVLGLRWEWISLVSAACLGSVAASSALLSQAPSSVAGGLWALGLEALLGSVIGLGASLAGHALVGASETSEAALGIRVNEDLGERGSLSILLVTASLAAGLSMGLHGPLLEAALALFSRLPLADGRGVPAWLPAAGGEAAGEWVEWLARGAFAGTRLALALATPVLLVQALVALSLAVLARGPGLTGELVAALAPALRLVLALVALGAAWSAFPEAFAEGL